MYLRVSSVNLCVTIKINVNRNLIFNYEYAEAFGYNNYGDYHVMSIIPYTQSRNTNRNYSPGESRNIGIGDGV